MKSTIKFRIHEEDWSEFVFLALGNNEQPSDLLRAFMEDFVAFPDEMMQHVDTPPRRPMKYFGSVTDEGDAIEAFKQACKDNHTRASSQLRKFIVDYNDFSWRTSLEHSPEEARERAKKFMERLSDATARQARKRNSIRAYVSDEKLEEIQQLAEKLGVSVPDLIMMGVEVLKENGRENEALPS